MKRISLDDYLQRRYDNERECEYVDGTLIERTGGDVAHALMHVEAGAYLHAHGKDWQIKCLMSYSMWTSATRIRIPDLVVLDDKLQENIRVTPPLLCVEILAPEDTPGTLLPRLEDIRLMGVPVIWLLDPIERLGFTYTSGGLQLVEGSRITLANSPIHLDLPELFSALD